MDPAIMSIIISAIGVIATWLSVTVSVNKGTAENYKQTGMILSTIQSLKDDMKDLKEESKDTNSRIGQIEHRVTKLEAYACNDNDRLARLEASRKEARTNEIGTNGRN